MIQPIGFLFIFLHRIVSEVIIQRSSEQSSSQRYEPSYL